MMIYSVSHSFDLYMARFLIEGGKPLSGEIPISGFKNAATPLIAATILVDGVVRFRNVPNIIDVERLCDMMRTMGVKIQREDHTLTVDARELDASRLDHQQVKKMRSSSLLIGPLVRRCGRLSIPEPGGCSLGNRPFEPHLLALRAFGVESTMTEEGYDFSISTLRQATITMSEFSPTGTENAILTAATILGQTRIYNAASDPHVQDLCHFLVQCGVEIQGIGTHELVINGVARIKGDQEYAIVPDTVETGSMICLAAASGSEITLTHAAPPSLMRMEIQKFEQMGVQMEVSEQKDSWHTLATIRVRPSKLSALQKVHVMPNPGFPSDLLPPFATLATQARGDTLIHEWMYEGRQKYLGELQRMGASIDVLDPHRAIIHGPTELHGETIESFDIRAGATLVIAALIAEGKSVITNIDQLDRGYERLEERLTTLGASIKRES